MGFKKNWDVAYILRQIHSAARECSSPYNDGFNQWEIKQDLYMIQETIDEALNRCSTFGDTEERWLKDREQRKIIKILKDEQ
jgi:hypothetical protein